MLQDYSIIKIIKNFFTNQYLLNFRSTIRSSRFWRNWGLAIACLCLILCFAKPAFSQQPVTIRVLVQALEANQWQPLITEFNSKHKNIRLEVISGPNNTNLVEDLYTSAFLLGDAPYDLVYMDIVWVQKFAAAGWLSDLSSWVTATELEDYLLGDIDGGRYQQQLYRMPFRTDGGMLYYRTDLLAKIGAKPPDTFNELIDISEKLQQANLAQWGYVWQGKQYEGLSAMFTEILGGYGGYWIDPNSQSVGLDQPEAIAAVKFLRETITRNIAPPGVTTYAEEETRRLFESGNTAFLRNWPYVYALASNSQIAGNFAIKPMVHAPGKNSGACLGGWGFGIVASSPHQAEAWAVIKFFHQPSVQRQYFLTTGYVPSRISLFNDPVLVEKFSYLPNLLSVVQNPVLRPPIPQYAQASDILQRYLSAALTGSQTPEKAMATAAHETRALLNR